MRGQGRFMRQERARICMRGLYRSSTPMARRRARTHRTKPAIDSSRPRTCHIVLPGWVERICHRSRGVLVFLWKESGAVHALASGVNSSASMSTADEQMRMRCLNRASQHLARVYCLLGAICKCYSLDLSPDKVWCFRCEECFQVILTQSAWSFAPD